MVRKYLVPETSESVVTLSKLIAYHPGSTMPELARLAGWGVNHTQCVLAACSRFGIAGFVRVGNYFHWYEAGKLAEARKADIERRLNNERQRWRTRKQRAEFERAYCAELDADSPADYFSHKVLPAGVPLPFTCQAPASVFHLGAA